MLRRVLTDPSNMRLEHIIPVQKRHLPIRLHPNFVLCVRGDMIQRRDMQLELARLCKFAQASAE